MIDFQRIPLFRVLKEEENEVNDTKKEQPVRKKQGEFCVLESKWRKWICDQLCQLLLIDLIYKDLELAKVFGNLEVVVDFEKNSFSVLMGITICFQGTQAWF